MDKQTYFINFENVSAADGNFLAAELRNALLDAAPGIEVDQIREETQTQDFGAIIVAIFGTSSVAAIAKALGDWLRLRNSASITIQDGNKKVIAKNISSKDAAGLSELFLNKM
jgi:hypothetical protein